MDNLDNNGGGPARKEARLEVLWRFWCTDEKGKGGVLKDIFVHSRCFNFPMGCWKQTNGL